MGCVKVAAIEYADGRWVGFVVDVLGRQGAEEANEADFVVDLYNINIIFFVAWMERSITFNSGREDILSFGEVVMSKVKMLKHTAINFLGDARRTRSRENAFAFSEIG